MSKRFAPADLPDRIPIFPLPGALLLPRARLPLNIFEPRYLAMLDDSVAGVFRPFQECSDSCLLSDWQV